MTGTTGSGTAPEQTDRTDEGPAGPASEETHIHLTRATLTVRGRIPDASNAVLLCDAVHEGRTLPCVYKPVAGERPLWDFPDGTLARRETAAYEISRAGGWDLVPATVLRDGPYGEGMVQAWVGETPRAASAEDAADGGPEPEEEAGAEQLLALVEGEEPGEGWKPVGFAEVGGGRTALLVHRDDPRLRGLAVLDAVINNGDRKGGHLLTPGDGRLYGIDHGVTFHVDDKLRTLLWGWAGEELTAEAGEMLRRLAAALAEGEPLAERLGELITRDELEALRKRTESLRTTGRHPLPSGDWPAIPWPPV
ncbi:SCO1664 family protein [Streptomyces sp. HNM0574]|uniref:SCO1664 family protein n=1 Tax=Streptomyces sp. HNM0574 TaxID=2714954 RepID=UPI00146F39A0|nr:SCO1664 family protein [Streptomyces sp. HNM0574]NLU66202.1 SCO1664 family protein [Streptomyces sp. HNM0574]